MTPDNRMLSNIEPSRIKNTQTVQPADDWSFLDVVETTLKPTPLSPEKAVDMQIRIAQSQLEKLIKAQLKSAKTMDVIYSAGAVCCGGHGSFSTAMEVSHLPHAETHCKRCNKTTCHEFGKCKECKTRGII